MTRRRDIRLLEFLAGESSERQAAALRSELAADKDLSERLHELRHLAGLLSEVAHPRFSPGFADRVSHRIHVMEEELVSARSPSFEAGFADRVMDRLSSDLAVRRRAARERGAETIDLVSVLPWGFRRLAPAAVLIAIALGAFSLSNAAQDQTATEALLGLQPVTLESIYSLSPLPEPDTPDRS